LKQEPKATLITFFNINFEFVPQDQTVNQAYCVEILKCLCEVVHRKRPELWPNDSILSHDNVPSHKVLSVKQFLAQKSISEMKHLLCSSDLVPNDFWLLLNIKPALKG
jgi:hypothetical protein